MTATMNRKADGFWKTGLWWSPETEHPIHAAIDGFFAAFFLARSIRLNRTWRTEKEVEARKPAAPTRPDPAEEATREGTPRYPDA